jgi:4-hydroxy-3-polyprenylbenzoate decarboxylase
MPVDTKVAMPGVLVVQQQSFINYDHTAQEMAALDELLKPHQDELNAFPLIIVADDAAFTAATLNNFLWVAFTRSNPSHDVYGINSFTKFKHWGCHGPMILDARIKPHHAPPLHTDAATEERIAHIFEKGGSLAGW